MLLADYGGHIELIRGWAVFDGKKKFVKRRGFEVQNRYFPIQSKYNNLFRIHTGN